MYIIYIFSYIYTIVLSYLMNLAFSSFFFFAEQNKYIGNIYSHSWKRKLEISNTGSFSLFFPPAGNTVLPVCLDRSWAHFLKYAYGLYTCYYFRNSRLADIWRILIGHMGTHWNELLINVGVVDMHEMNKEL